MSSLIDLDELMLRCRNSIARDYIREAVACYKVGAFRSSIVTTWNAVVFDYIAKLRELDLTGDSNARKKLEEFQTICSEGSEGLKRSLDFERKLLDTASSEFEMFTPLEKIDLERLKEDRNRCAHPSMQNQDEPYKPSAEMARSHLRNAVEIFLQREPVCGKSVLDQICKQIRSEYFPQEVQGAIDTLACGPLKRARESLVRNLIVILSKEYFMAETEVCCRRNIITAIKATQYLYPGISERAIADKLSSIVNEKGDAGLALAVNFCVKVESAWNSLKDPQKATIKRYVEISTDKNLPFVLAVSLGFHELSDIAKSRIVELDNTQIQWAVNQEMHPAFLPDAIKRFKSAQSFRSAEVIFENLILKMVEFCRVEDVRVIFIAVIENYQIKCAAGIPKLLVEFVERSQKNKTDVKEEVRKIFADMEESGDLIETFKFVRDSLFPMEAEKVSQETKTPLESSDILF